jgi:uncharacterized membrane protein YhaH (DUF805 family)
VDLFDLIWAIIVIYALLVALMILVAVFADLLRDRELSGWAKAGWVIVLFFLPVLGVLAYVIIRHRAIMQHMGAAEDAARRDRAAG